MRKPASQKPPQKPRNVETAAKKPEQTGGGGEDTEERQLGEEGGPAEQEEKVLDAPHEIQHQCLKCTIFLVMLTDKCPLVSFQLCFCIEWDITVCCSNSTL